MRKRSKGFTLVELLVAIGIIGVLLAIVIVAINPANQFARSRNVTRLSNVRVILDAVGQYQSENNGQLPPSITSSPQNISDTAANLCSLLVPSYLTSLPIDPSIPGPTEITDCNAAYNTGYQVALDATNRVTVSAPSTELGGTTISVTR